MGKKSRAKKEAATSEASTSGPSTARSESGPNQPITDATQQMSGLSLEKKAQHPKKETQSQQPNKETQSQQPKQEKKPQQQQPPKPKPQEGQKQGGPSTSAQGQQRPPQNQQPQKQGGQTKQQRPGEQQPASARGPKQGQSGQPHQQQHGSQQQRPPQDGQRKPESGQQATPWTQRPAQGGDSSGTQQRPGQGGDSRRSAGPSKPPQRPTHGKGDQKQSTPRPAIIPYDYKICEYKGQGTRGKPVKIETNYLKLDVAKLVPKAYHYDVTLEFEPPAGRPVPKKYMHPVFAAFVRANFPRASLAYDGQKNAYAPAKLNLSDYNRVVNIVDTETAQSRQFRVEIREVNGSEIDLGILRDYSRVDSIDVPMRAIQCLDIVLKAAFQNRNFEGKLVGRSFYMRPERPVDLGDFYELWIGMFQSTILGRIPYVNVDIAHKAFPRRTELIELIKQIGYNFRERRDVNLNNELDYQTINNVTNHLKGLEIGYNMPGGGTRAYKFAGLTEAASKLKFSMEGKTVTVEQYFRSRNHQLRYPNLPCVSTPNKTFFPVELCFVIGGQAVQKKTTENQTRAMIREAATSTDVRKQKIMDMLRRIQYNQSNAVTGFGLTVGDRFAEIPARILDAPMLQYNGRAIKPQRGEWRGENAGFLEAQKVINWGVLMLDNRTRESDVRDMCEMIKNISKTNGMQFNDKYLLEFYNGRTEKDMDQKLDKIKAGACNVLFCVIPDRGDAYARVKQAAELRCGVLTQCIKALTVQRKGKDASTISNILLKVNAKLNGFNHKLQKSPILNGKKCMVIGADVTHPSPDQSRIPSVVGVAASHDKDAFKYNICWRLQDPRQEMIQDFGNIISEQLDYYKLKNNTFPERILYFRDGVSEGQFSEVQNVELTALQNACKLKYGSDYMNKVKITMVVVQKRHHTRFFPGTSGIGSSDRKNNNVPPGTIVDREITAPKENHFYLVSHQSIQGVAKPTKYCILHDDGNTLSIDDLQALTYDLCHLFTRCNRAVSYPAPTYYAHLAAYRGRVYIEGRNDLNMDNLEREWKNRTIREEIRKGHPMYFV